MQSDLRLNILYQTFFYLITRWGSWFPFINWNWGYFSLTTAKYLIKKINCSFIRGNWWSEIASTSVAIFVWFPHYPSVNYNHYIRIAFCEGNVLHIRTSWIFVYLLHLWRCPVVSDISFAHLRDSCMIHEWLRKSLEWPIFLYWDLYHNGHESWTCVDGFVLQTLNSHILTDY